MILQQDQSDLKADDLKSSIRTHERVIQNNMQDINFRKEGVELSQIKNRGDQTFSFLKNQENPQNLLDLKRDQI